MEKAKRAVERRESGWIQRSGSCMPICARVGFNWLLANIVVLISDSGYILKRLPCSSPLFNFLHYTMKFCLLPSILLFSTLAVADTFTSFEKE
jgi:hypothetical protein